MNEKLESYLKDIIEKVFSIKVESISLSKPPKKELGDFAFGGFELAKQLKKSPADIVSEMAESIPEGGDIISKVSVEGPYLNIFLNGDSYLEDFISATTADNDPRHSGIVIIDYIGANVGKPLHIGHMCTPNVGQTLINAHKELGYTVISDSHIGDWGIIFGKLITAYQKYGDEKKLESDAVNHLFDLYVQISELAESDELLEQEFRDTFKSLAEGDTQLKELWEKITASSIDAMNQALSRINVFPDHNIGESFYEGIGLSKMGDYPDLTYNMNQIVEELVEKGIATRNDDNSVGVEFAEELKIPSCILQKRDGTHGYLASDLATIKYRMENWAPDKIVYSVDVRQQLHLRQVFIIAHQAGWTTRDDGIQTELTHAYNGFISLKDGAMSTRKGRIVRLGDLLDETERRAADIILEKRSDIAGDELNQLSKVIGIGAIKYGYLKKSRETDIVFDWDEFMTFEGNSGPYIQYSYVRAMKILVKEPTDIDTSALTSRELSSDVTSLMTEILGYQAMLENSMATYHPHIICQYAYSLARSFNAFYNNESVVHEEDQNYKNIKLYLTAQFAQRLKDTFAVLGIDMPEKM